MQEYAIEVEHRLAPTQGQSTKSVTRGERNDSDNGPCDAADNAHSDDLAPDGIVPNALQPFRNHFAALSQTVG
jgi:hypothetical protein